MVLCCCINLKKRKQKSERIAIIWLRKVYVLIHYEGKCSGKSQVNYRVEVYPGCNSGNRNRIISILHRFVRFAYGRRLRAQVSDHLKCFRNLSFENYLKFRLIIYLFRILKFQNPVFIAQMISLTSFVRTPQIIISRICNWFFEHSFMVHVARSWNILPADMCLFAISLSVFRRKPFPFRNRNTGTVRVLLLPE